MIVLLYKDAFLNTNKLNPALPSSIISILQVHGSPKIANDMGNIIIEKSQEILVEGLDWNIFEVEHIDFTSVNNFDIHPITR